jgi:hypothetical protein
MSVFGSTRCFGHLCSYHLTGHRLTKALEDVLAKKTQPNVDTLTVEQLAIKIGATETQAIEAALGKQKDGAMA